MTSDVRMFKMERRLPLCLSYFIFRDSFTKYVKYKETDKNSAKCSNNFSQNVPVVGTMKRKYDALNLNNEGINYENDEEINYCCF